MIHAGAPQNVTKGPSKSDTHHKVTTESDHRNSRHQKKRRTEYNHVRYQVMPKLHMIQKTKKETYRTTRHESYSIVIPYEISKSFHIADGMTLHATVSEDTGTVRLHRNPKENSMRVLLRHKLTKTYKKQKYHSTRVTIPIEIVKRLKLAKGDQIDVTESKNSLVLRKTKLHRNLP